MPQRRDRKITDHRAYVCRLLRKVGEVLPQLDVAGINRWQGRLQKPIHPAQCRAKARQLTQRRIQFRFVQDPDAAVEYVKLATQCVEIAITVALCRHQRGVELQELHIGLRERPLQVVLMGRVQILHIPQDLRAEDRDSCKGQGKQHCRNQDAYARCHRCTASHAAASCWVGSVVW